MEKIFRDRCCHGISADIFRCTVALYHTICTCTLRTCYSARRLNSTFWEMILVFDSWFSVLFLSDIEPYNFVENFFSSKVIRLDIFFLFFWSSWIRKKLESKRNLAGLVCWEIKNVLHVRVNTCKYAISGLKMVRFDIFFMLLLSPLSSVKQESNLGCFLF